MNEALDTLIARRANLQADLAALEKQGAEGLELVAAADGDMEGTRLNVTCDLRTGVWQAARRDLRAQIHATERAIHRATEPQGATVGIIRIGV